MGKMTTSLAKEMLDEFGRPTKQALIKSSHRNSQKKSWVTSATNGVPSDGDFSGTESESSESSEDEHLPTNVEVNLLFPLAD